MLRFLKFWKIRPRFFESSALPVWDAAGAEKNPWDKGGGFAGVNGRLASALTTQTVYTGCSTVLNIGLGASVVWLVMQQPQLEVVAFQFDPSGRVHNTLVADGRTIDETRAAYFVASYIDAIRKISPDKTDMRKDWEFALSISTPQAKAMLTKKEAEDELGDAFAVNPAVARQVVEPYVTPQNFDADTGVGTFLLTWGEITFQNGRPSPVKKFTGVITTTSVMPSNKEAAMSNPLGMWVTSINWQESPK